MWFFFSQFLYYRF